MARSVNPINPSTLIDLGDAFSERPSSFGRIKNSGLFQVENIVDRSHMYKYEPFIQARMTGLTSLTERDKWKTTGSKGRAIGLSSSAIALTDSIQYEDVAGRVRSWDNMSEMTITDLALDKLDTMGRSFDMSMEYMFFTAAQGVMLNPEDASDALDMFDVTGITRETDTWDLTQATGVLDKINAITNRMVEYNTRGGNLSGIEIPVADDVFNKLASHPELVAMYEAAYYGSGLQYINNPFINRSVNTQVRDIQGMSRSFTVEGVTFTTYPEKFRKWDGTAVDAISSGKGFTIARGLSDLYQVKYTPAPYISQLGNVGQEQYAWRTPIKNDTHFEVFLESYPIIFMKDPKLSIDITFTLA